jgi:hypothetical protein
VAGRKREGDADDHGVTGARPPRGRGRLYSTSNNKDLARELDLALCAERCRAFAELRAFVRGIVAKNA